MSRPRAAVHIVHGLAEHPGRYARLAAALNAAGLIVWGHAHRGHGTNPVPGIRGHFADRDGWKAIVDDAWAVSQALLASRPGIRLVLFAHSMGSFVGQRVVAENGAAYAACVFSGTNGPPAFREQLGRPLAHLQVGVLGPRTPGRWFQRLIIEDTYNRAFGRHAPPNTWLSRDVREVEKYNTDPLCGFTLTAQAWLDLTSARAAQGSVDFFRRIPASLPIRIIAGSSDPVGEQGKGVQRLIKAFSDAGLTASSRFYEGARHELVNETNRDEVTSDLIAWLDTVLVP